MRSSPLLVVLLISMLYAASASMAAERSQLMAAVAKADHNLFFKEVAKQPIYVQGSLSARYLQTNNLTVNAFSYVSQNVIAKRNVKAKVLVATDTFTTQDITTTVVSSPDSSVPLQIQARMQIDGKIIFGHENINETIQDVLRTDPDDAVIHGDVQGVAFIEEMSVTHSHGHKVEEGQESQPNELMKQWKLVVHEDFDSKQMASGWRWTDGTDAQNHVHHCGNGDMFMMGACQSTGEQFTRLDKTFALPAHSQLELQARVHFIDRWQGGSAYAMIDGQIVWLDTHANSDDSDLEEEEGISLCGSPDVYGDRLSVPIRVIVPHTASEVKISFGSNMEHMDGAGNCVAALGVDDVSLSVH